MFIITMLLYVNSNKGKEEYQNNNYNINNTQTQNQSITPSSIDKFSEVTDSATVQSTSSTNNLQFGFLGFSSIFLVITIIFSILFAKHQQKRHHKSSK